MKNILNVYRWRSIKKGFFGGETLKGEFLMFTFEHKNAVFLFQFMQQYKDDLYIVALAHAFETPDYEVVQDFYDEFEYLANHETLEKNLKVNVTMTSSGMKVVLSNPSKYLGKTIDIIHDSRLDRGMYMAKAKLAKDVEPAIVYKKGGDLAFAKKMRAYTAARSPKPKGGKKWTGALS